MIVAAVVIGLVGAGLGVCAVLFAAGLESHREHRFASELEERR